MRNLITVFIGAFVIIICCTTAFLAQKHLFSEYKNKVKNVVTDTKKSDN